LSNFHLAIDLSQAYGDFFFAATKASFLTIAGIAVIPLAVVAGTLLMVRVLSRHRIERQLLYAFFEHIPDNVYFKDRNGRFIRINRAMADYFGLAEPSDAIKKSDSDIFTSEHSHQAFADEQEIIRTGQALIGKEEKETWPDGHVTWVLTTKVPLRNQGGRIIGTMGISHDITNRKRIEQELEDYKANLETLVAERTAELVQANEERSAALQESEQRSRETDRITELVDLLQACQTIEEAFEVIGAALPSILSSPSGALCITSPSRDLVEVVSTWGDTLATEKVFSPYHCWSLRRGKLHLVKDPHSPMGCAHVTGPAASGYLCIPLAAQGETLGTIYVELPAPPESSFQSMSPSMETISRPASAVAERVSMALANLRLRDVLRDQSIRDPLTGLFNRRYMEATLERELRRAARDSQSLAFLMIDIDHFKMFNDTFGHHAGDTLLRAVGEFLGQGIRGQDVACRFGGEEFVLILTDTSLEIAYRRAEVLREEIACLAVQHNGQTLGKITMSAGIAAFPDHGTSSEELIRKSDMALYKAKKDGRDRIETA